MIPALARTSRRFAAVSLVALVIIAAGALFLIARQRSPREETASSLVARIAALRLRARYGEALTPARKLLAVRRASPAAEYEIADAERLVATLERASAMDAAARHQLAEADRLLAMLSEEHCDVDEMARLAERQYALRRRHLGDSHEEVGASLHVLARWIHESGDRDRSESLYRAALANRRVGLGPDHPLVAETASDLVSLVVGVRGAAEVESLYAEVFRIRERAFGTGDHPERAKTLRLRALIDFAAADSYERAAGGLEEVLAMRQRLFGEHHPDVTGSIADLAGARLMAGDLASAESLNRRALEGKRRFHTRTPCELVPTLYNMAYILREQGEPREAIPFVREAVEIRRRMGPENHHLATQLEMLARLHSDLGEYELAAPLFEESVRLCERDLGPRARATLWVCARLALARIHLNDVRTADSLLVAALHGARELDEGQSERLIGEIEEYQALGRDRAGRFAAAESLLVRSVRRNLQRVGLAHRQVATLYERIAEARAGRRDLEGAEAYLSRAAQSFELARDHAGGGTKSATFKPTPYEGRALARLELGRPREAWEDVERCRGRLLAEGLLDQPVPFELARVQKALAPRAAIVGWIDHDLRHGMPRSWGYVIRDAGPVRWTRLPRTDTETAEALGRRFHAFRDAIARARVSRIGADDPPWETARALWLERIAPLVEHLEGIDDLVTIPSGAMAGLPVESFMAPDGSLLGDRWTVTYTASAAVHAWLAEREAPGAPGPRRGLLVGDAPFRIEHLGRPRPDAAPARPVGGSEMAVLRSAVTRDPTALGHLPRLHWSRAEVTGIARCLPGAVQLLGTDASEPALLEMAKSETLAGFDVVHLATHALVDNLNPEVSMLVLSQVGLPVPAETRGAEGADGVITATEIARDWKLDAKLVTLSGCETARGREVFGEGTVGLAYPLIRAGARSVLASLWTVNDEATALLMTRFYENWTGTFAGERAGRESTAMTKAEALREAKHWLRTLEDSGGGRRYEHPYYWSAFVLFGAPD